MYCPSQASGFEKEYFKYDKDEYICPQGQKLTYRRTEEQYNRKIYLIEISCIVLQILAVAFYFRCARSGD